MIKKKQRPHCDASMNEHRHGLSQAMLLSMKALYARAGDQPLNIKELKLTRNQWDNFQKIKYWGFVLEVPNSKGKKKQGVWRLTPHGIAFMKGNVQTQKNVWTYRGTPISFEGEVVTIFDVFPTAYRKREDYQADARGHE